LAQLKKRPKRKPARATARPTAPSAPKHMFIMGISVPLRRFAIWLRARVQKFKGFAYALESLVIAVPPYLVGQYYQIDQFANSVRKDWPVIAAMLDHNIAVAVVLSGVWAFIVLSIVRGLTWLAYDKPDGWQHAPEILLAALDNIVGSKEQRFSKHLKTVRELPSTPTAGEVFGFITQPSRQLDELILGVYSTFDSLLRKQESEKYVLKVNLAAVDANCNIGSIRVHYPSNLPVRSSIDMLNSRNSAMKSAARGKRTIVIESTLQEVARSKGSFVVTDESRADENGSLICYPVTHDALGGMVVFVISIHVNKPWLFRQKYAHTYIELLKPFALRINLEYSLMALKEIVQ